MEEQETAGEEQGQGIVPTHCSSMRGVTSLLPTPSSARLPGNNC